MTKVTAAYPYILTLFIAFIIGDLAVLLTRPYIIPNSSHQPIIKGKSLSSMPKSVYASINTRNIFSADGTQPPALLPSGMDPNKLNDLPPVPTTLPLSLIGTIVHSNSDRSIANIELKGKNKTLAYTPNREIEGMATIEKIERGRVVIRNSNSGRLEFLQIDLGGKINLNSKVEDTPKATLAARSGNSFEISRKEVDKQLSDMNSILMQAASAPVKGPDGEIIGWKLLSIQPNSVFTQLGLVAGDVIKGVNGEPIDSMAKAMELFQALKNADRIQMSVNRGGKDETYSYTIK